jgi:transposase-like protein
MNLAELAAIVSDEAKAFALVERIMWPNGPVCPHCDASERIYALQGVKDKKGRGRHGLKKCGHCRKQFTVRVGTIFEDSHIPLGKWLLAIHQMCSSKKGISARQLQRELGISYQAAWFMCHRVREAMTEEPLASMLGAGGGIVELVETYVGGKVSNNLHRNKTAAAGKKVIVMTLIDREGDARTVIVPDTRKSTLQAVAKPIVDKSATIMTDAHLSYEGLDDYFHAHHAVDHSREFVRAVILHRASDSRGAGETADV